MFFFYRFVAKCNIKPSGCYRHTPDLDTFQALFSDEAQLPAFNWSRIPTRPGGHESAVTISGAQYRRYVIKSTAKRHACCKKRHQHRRPPQRRR